MGQLGDYQLGERVDCRHAGDVWETLEAVETATGQPCHVTFLPSGTGTNSALSFSLERVRHFTLAGRLNEDAFVRIRDYGEDGDRIYVVSDVNHELTLTEYLRNHGPLAPAVALKITQAILGALSSAHGVHVFDGALRSDQVRLRLYVMEGASFQAAAATPAVRLAWFGTGAMHWDKQHAASIHDQSIAPEVRQSERPRPGADIYSAGILMYEMLSGVRIASPADLEQAVRHSRGHGEKRSQRLATLLEQAVAVDESRRPSAEALSDALAETLEFFGSVIEGVLAIPLHTAPLNLGLDIVVEEKPLAWCVLPQPSSSYRLSVNVQGEGAATAACSPGSQDEELLIVQSISALSLGGRPLELRGRARATGMQFQFLVTLELGETVHPAEIAGGAGWQSFSLQAEVPAEEPDIVISMRLRGRGHLILDPLELLLEGKPWSLWDPAVDGPAGSGIRQIKKITPHPKRRIRENRPFPEHCPSTPVGYCLTADELRFIEGECDAEFAEWKNGQLLIRESTLRTPRYRATVNTGSRFGIVTDLEVVQERTLIPSTAAFEIGRFLYIVDKYLGIAGDLPTHPPSLSHEPDWSLLRLRESARSNVAVSQFILGAIYETGDGVERDLDEARRWYTRAADQDYGPAAARLRLLPGKERSEPLCWRLEESHDAILRGDTRRLEAILRREPKNAWGRIVAAEIPLKDGRVHAELIIDPLHLAAIWNQADAAKLLLQLGADPDACVSRLGYTALHLAAIAGSVEAAQVLLDHGAHVHARGEGGGTPLLVAMLEGSESVLMSEEHIRMGGPPSRYLVPLPPAASAGRREAIIRLLLSHGADPASPDMFGRTPIRVAIRENLTPITDLMLAALREQRRRTFLSVDPMQSGRQLAARALGLHEAAASDDPELVTRLIALGADVNADDSFEGTPLTAAVTGGHFHAAVALLDAGASASAGAWNALRAAVQSDATRMVDLMLARGADPESRDWNGSTPLHEVRSAAMVDCFAFVRGASLDARDENERTPLVTAIDADRTAAAIALIERGADVGLPDGQGHTPLHFAAGRGDRSVVEKLLAAGANPNAADDSGRTPLHESVLGELEIVVLLVEKGADPLARGLSWGKEKTPIDLAEENDRLDVAALLRSRIR